MIRVVLAASLTLALLAASLPAVDDARTDRTRGRLDAALERIERAATSLATSEDPTRVAGVRARRVVTVRLPAASWTSAPVAWVAVGGYPGGPRGDLLAYRLAGAPPTTVELDGVDLRTGGDPVVLRGDGRRTLGLELASTDGRPVVRVALERPR